MDITNLFRKYSIKGILLLTHNLNLWFDLKNKQTKKKNTKNSYKHIHCTVKLNFGKPLSFGSITFGFSALQNQPRKLWEKWCCWDYTRWPRAALFWLPVTTSPTSCLVQTFTWLITSLSLFFFLSVVRRLTAWGRQELHHCLPSPRLDCTKAVCGPDPRWDWSWNYCQ